MSKKLSVFIGRFELATNAVSGAVATIAITRLFKDGSIIIGNITTTVVLLLISLAIYSAASWVLMELSENEDNERKND